MLNVDQLIKYKTKEKEKGLAFSFKNLARYIIERQEMKKDTIIAIVGERRNGKSNWGLKLILSFIKLKRELEPGFKWSWGNNFAKTPAEAPRKAEKLPDKSFVVMDEAGDIAYRGDANTKKTKDLVKFFNKCGTKRLLTLWILPDIYQLNPKILNMCLFMVIVPYRHKDICASAFIIGRSPNALTQDKFGLERIKRLLASRKMNPMVHSGELDGKARVTQNEEKIIIPFPKQLFTFYKTLPGYKHSHWFRPVNKHFEAGYIKNVKDKQLMAHELEEKYVRKTFYDRMKRQYETVLFNLFEKQGLSYQQILSLHMDEDQNFLSSRETIARKIGGARVRFEV